MMVVASTQFQQQAVGENWKATITVAYLLARNQCHPGRQNNLTQATLGWVLNEWEEFPDVPCAQHTAEDVARHNRVIWNLQAI